MRAVVVYESMYGCTHRVAEAVVRGLGDGAVAVSVHQATPEVVAGAELLVVGAPTHIHGMSRPSTRAQAVKGAELEATGVALDPDAAGDGVREWLDSLDHATGTPAVAFDTRLDGPAAFTGRASKSIDRVLRHHGYRTVVDPQSFLVSKQNQLQPEEEARAEGWGRQIAAEVAGRVASR